MIHLLLSALLLSPLASGRSCDCSHYTALQDPAGDTVQWLNGLAASWYDINEVNLFQMLTDILATEVNSQLPFFIRSLTLTKLSLVKTPQITLVTSSVQTVLCDDAKFKKYTMDLNLKIDTPEALAEASVNFYLGMYARVSVEDFTFEGTLRVEILMSSDLGFPGMQYAKITFINRPEMNFDVELYDLIGLDTFGIASLLYDMLEDLIQETLVYPGMVYLDLSPISRGGEMEVVMINNDPELHPAVMSANVTVTPLNITNPRFTIESWFDFGDDETKKVMLGNGKNHQFDVFLSDFEYSDARVRVLERNVISYDTVWADIHINIPELFRAGDTKRTHNLIHREGKSSWNVTIDVFAYLLPPVHMTRNGTEVGFLPSLMTLANCTECTEYGVLYLHVHRAANLSFVSEIDPYVVITLDGKEIKETEIGGSDPNPVFNERIEVMIRNDGKPLESRVLEFHVYDWDRFSSDDYIGAATLSLTKDLLVNQRLGVYRHGNERGHLYITMIFRPVPFF